MTQLIDNIKANVSVNDNTVTVVLRPEELGRVHVKLVEEHGEITAVLHVEKNEVKDRIQRELPHVMAALGSNGIQIRKVEVVLENHNNETDNGQSFLQNGSDQAGSGGSSESGARNSDYGSSAIASDTFQALPQQDSMVQMQMSDDAINVYM